MAPGVDLGAHSPPARIPKLKYRNPLPSDHVPPSSTSLQGSSSSTPSQVPPSSTSFQVLPSSTPSQETARRLSCAQERPATPDSRAPSTASRPSFESANLTSPSLAPTASSATSSNASKTSRKKKKKAASVLGFLSLKEPSHVALEQFAEQQRKQTATKGTSLLSLQHGNIFAGKQLPQSVPKVNSKWDGVPDAVKSRNSTANKDKRSILSSGASPSTHLKTAPWNGSNLSISTDGSRNPPNSIASGTTSKSTSTTSNPDIPIKASPSTAKLPNMSYYFPDAPAMSVRLPASALEADTSHESNAGPPPTLPDLTRPESGEFRADSPASSTDTVDTIVRGTAEVILKKMNDQDRSSPWGEDTLAVQRLDENKLGDVPDSHGFLFAPSSDRDTPAHKFSSVSTPFRHYVPTRPTQNFSRPVAHQDFTSPAHHSTIYRSATSNSALPTLYESSLISTESLGTVRDNDSQSMAPSTITPSELSRHWYESPRERLGLGGRLRVNDVLPWDKQGNSPGKPKKKRLSMFGIGAAKA